MYKTKTLYYFAYGSNMNFKQMHRRCPHAQFVGRAKIQNYQLFFAGRSWRWKGGGATIVPKSGSQVWGGVFKLDEDCFKKLNGFEGVNYKKYIPKTMVCSYSNGQKRRVVTYIRKSSYPNKPSSRYKRTILSGMKDSGLSKNYINFVERLWS